MPLTNAEKQKQYWEKLKERFRAAELREKESKRHKVKRAQNIDKVRTKDKERQQKY